MIRMVKLIITFLILILDNWKGLRDEFNKSARNRVSNDNRRAIEQWVLDGSSGKLRSSGD